jgi:hypothetical protein
VEHALAWLAPADALRRAWLGAVGPWARPLIVDRDRRIAVGFTFAVVVALALATAAPLHLLAMGPLVLGVPHVLADLRYLVAQPGYHRRLWVVAFVGVPLVLLAWTSDPRVGFLAVAGAGLAASRGTALRRALVVVAGAGLALVAHAWPRDVSVAFAHLHNLVAFVCVAAIGAERRRRTYWAPYALAAGACVLVSSGATLAVARSLGTVDGAPFGVSLFEQSMILAPQLSPPWDERLVVLFAFAQSVHYAIWLRVLPDAMRPGKTPRSFTQSARALVADLGTLVPLAALLLAIGFAAHAAIDARGARIAYFSFALFHGYLELAALGILFAERGRARAA